MRIKKYLLCVVAGFAAGSVTGLFGAGGGMVLVPLLCWLTDIEEDAIFPASVSIILPICLICLTFRGVKDGLPWIKAAPYLIGSGLGGIFAGILGRRIPTIWLHRLLGAMILWGGFRYLC